MQTEMTPVPYKGAAPAIADLMGNQVDLLCDQTTNTTSQIEAKKVKAYAVTTPQRLGIPALKDLPTLQELGLKDFQVTIWHGLYAPKGTPAAVVKKLNEALKLSLKDPDFIKRQEALGAVIANDSRTEPEGHKKSVQAEIDKWGKVIKAAGIYADGHRPARARGAPRPRPPPPAPPGQAAFFRPGVAGPRRARARRVTRPRRALRRRCGAASR